jgi:hypothetical protein
MDLNWLEVLQSGGHRLCGRALALPETVSA